MNRFYVVLYFGAWHSREFVKETPMNSSELYEHYKDFHPTATINIVDYEPSDDAVIIEEFVARDVANKVFPSW